MTSIHLDDHVAKSLESLARSQGLSLPDYLTALARKGTDDSLPNMSGDQILELIDAESSVGSSQYRGTFTRDEIYRDHD